MEPIVRASLSNSVTAALSLIVINMIGETPAARCSSLGKHQ